MSWTVFVPSFIDVIVSGDPVYEKFCVRFVPGGRW